MRGIGVLKNIRTIFNKIHVILSEILKSMLKFPVILIPVHDNIDYFRGSNNDSENNEYSSNSNNNPNNPENPENSNDSDDVEMADNNSPESQEDSNNDSDDVEKADVEEIEDHNALELTMDDLEMVNAGLHGDPEALEETKREYSEFFTDRTDREALLDIRDYLEGELTPEHGISEIQVDPAKNAVELERVAEYFERRAENADDPERKERLEGIADEYWKAAEEETIRATTLNVDGIRLRDDNIEEDSYDSDSSDATVVPSRRPEGPSGPSDNADSSNDTGHSDSTGSSEGSGPSKGSGPSDGSSGGSSGGSGGGSSAGGGSGSSGGEGSSGGSSVFSKILIILCASFETFIQVIDDLSNFL